MLITTLILILILILILGDPTVMVTIIVIHVSSSTNDNDDSDDIYLYYLHPLLVLIINFFTNTGKVVRRKIPYMYNHSIADLYEIRYPSKDVVDHRIIASIPVPPQVAQPISSLIFSTPFSLSNLITLRLLKP